MFRTLEVTSKGALIAWGLPLYINIKYDQASLEAGCLAKDSALNEEPRPYRILDNVGAGSLTF